MRAVLPIVALLGIACGSSHETSTPPAGPNNTGSTPCEDVAPSPECPATWKETIGAGKSFCARPGKQPNFNVSRSNGACGAWLRYSTYLFDGGPRNCLYDPKTEKLAGFAFFDGKAGRQKRSCNVEQSEAVFPPDCAHLTCSDPGFGP